MEKQDTIHKTALLKDAYVESEAHIVYRQDVQTAVPATELQEAAARIFAASIRFNVVLLSTATFTRAVAMTGKRLPAKLDDLAQLCGPSVPAARGLGSIRGSKARRTALFIQGLGCLCCADNLYEAHALAMVVEKASLAHIGSTYLGSSKRISRFEALLMRGIYLIKYSKQAAKT